MNGVQYTAESQMQGGKKAGDRGSRKLSYPILPDPAAAAAAHNRLYLTISLYSGFAICHIINILLRQIGEDVSPALQFEIIISHWHIFGIYRLG